MREVHEGQRKLTPFLSGLPNYTKGEKEGDNMDDIDN